MHLAYGDAHYNGCAALYVPKMFSVQAWSSYDLRTCAEKIFETGCFTRVTVKRDQTMRTPDHEKNMLRLEVANQSTSTRAIVQQLSISHLIHCMEDTVRKANAFILSAKLPIFRVCRLSTPHDFSYLVCSTDCGRQRICYVRIVRR